MSEARIADLLAVRAFGARCLVDLLTVLETLLVNCDIEGRALVREAQRLRATWAIAEVHTFDPRLGQLVRGVGVAGETLAELIRNVVAGRVEATPSYEIGRRLSQVREALTAADGLSVRDELAQVLSAMFGERDGQLIALSFGWTGCPPLNVDELAAGYDLSPGRVRQICLRAGRQAKTIPTYTPALDRAARWIAEHLPCDLNELRRRWQAHEELAGGLGLEKVVLALKFFGEEVPAAWVDVGDGAVLVPRGRESQARDLWRVMRSLVHHRQIASVSEVTARIAGAGEATARGLARQIVAAAGSWDWLDEGQNWFAPKSPEPRGLARRIRDTLAWVERLDVETLRKAAFRGQRPDGSRTPESVFLEFCRRLDGVAVEGHQVGGSTSAAGGSRPQGVEAIVVQVLHRHGPVLDRRAWETLCTEVGVNRFTFRRVIAQSPMVVPLDRGQYGLLGHDLRPPKTCR